MTPPLFRETGSLPQPLPRPSAEEVSIGRALALEIREEIRSNGPIDFARFMELALYAPGLGYYSAGHRKFAAAGDFITAPEVGPMFAHCLARQCVQIFSQLGTSDILEAGAGSGVLAADLLLELERLGNPATNYFILELSADLRERQTLALKRRAPRWLPHVQWLDALPAPGFRGIVLGNELLDAMPVTRFRIGDEGIEELCVDWNKDGFAWRPRPAGAVVRDRVGALALPSGYISEIGFRAEAWIKSMAERLEQGVLLLVDYGFPRAEFHHPQRERGTLMCHYRHRAHDDPLVLVGLQDITAHVDFTAVAEAGTEAGLKLLGYTSQAGFLLGCGLEQIVAKSDPEDVRPHLALTQQIKKLTLPSEMGELYKVIALGRRVDTPLMGFAVQDRRGRL